MSSNIMENSKLGKAIRANSNGLSSEVFLSICLYYEKIKKDSAWKPFIDVLPTNFSTMPLYFTDQEVRMLDGPMRDLYEYQVQALQSAFEASERVEKAYPEFKGLANKKGLKWAACVTRSRSIPLGDDLGRSLVPLIDMVNHHPVKGVVLELDEQQASFRAKEFCPSGSEFFFSYYSSKSESDHMYMMTYGFLLNQNDISTFAVNFNYDFVQNENIQQILYYNQCGYIPEVLSDADAKIPQHFLDCVAIFALNELNDPNIKLENYKSHITRQIQLRARQLVGIFLDMNLDTFKLNDEKELLLRPDLTQNMKNILLVRMSDKKVLNHGKELLKKLV